MGTQSSTIGGVHLGIAYRSLDVLVLDEWIPYPPVSGKHIRTWSLLRRLSKRHKIMLLCYGEPDGEAAGMVRSMGIDLKTVGHSTGRDGWRFYASLLKNCFERYPYSVTKHFTHEFEHRLNTVIRDHQFDLVQFEWTPYARYLRVAKGIPSLIMAHNIEAQIWQRRALHSGSVAERSFFRLQARKMESFEKQVFRSADMVTPVTSIDAEQARHWGAKSVMVVENGVDVDYFSPVEVPTHPSSVLLLGSLDWYPNVDAAGWFMNEILPLISRSMEGTILQIVGRNPSRQIQEMVSRHPRVELIGDVPDVRPYLAQATVVVVPLRIGGGSRIKILESMAMEKAIVSTSVGAEGLEVTDKVHLLLADTPQEFADRTVELLKSPDQISRLGRQGRKLVNERYTWDAAAVALETAWLSLCDHKTARQNGESEGGGRYP